MTKPLWISSQSVFRLLNMDRLGQSVSQSEYQIFIITIWFTTLYCSALTALKRRVLDQTGLDNFVDVLLY